MRVVQVSAHYPPNFVSGGTLVPQRVARGLAGRGHESYVYAGFLDERRAPLSGWSEMDDAGVHVRWVVTTPWTAWDDRRNWDNPAIAKDFAEWLRRVRPDVVHIHSLQTLGGGLVVAAKESGAAVVVTMHDFWWSCARQFLVDRDLRPCSLVVTCGVCECQVDHAWLVERTAHLAEQLASADLVLAPSRSAARVFEANGVDPARLRVDENGVPDEVLARVGSMGRRAGATDRVRFMFAGGDDPMKGGHVLLEAIRSLPAEETWELDLYGVRERPAGLPDAVRARPGFRPEELVHVLGTHDVLVLPSVMRESHSILTREALAAGLSVVCTDTLGPEEVVVHGENGLVVSAGDAAALAAALARLVNEPGLLGRLRSAPPGAPLRSADDQVAGLIEIYDEVHGRARAGSGLAGGRADRDQDAEGPHRVLFVVGINGAPLRYRVRLAAEALRMSGASTKVRHYRDPELVELVQRADAVVFYRVPATRQVVELMAAVRNRRPAVPILFDIDDLIFDPDLRGQVHGLEKLSEDEERLWWRGVARYRTTMEHADLYIGSTEMLRTHAARVTGLPTRRFANGVGVVLGQASDRALRRPRGDGPPRIGYFSGTTTHDEDWARVEPAVVRFMTEHPDWELWLGGHLVPTPALDAVDGRVRRLPMVSWTELPTLLRDVDVNLAPLVPGSIFNEAKSAIKWLEAALVATPTIATPTQPFREAIEDGRTGILASSEEEWYEALRMLAEDPAERSRIGNLARREALLGYSPQAQARAYREILRDAVDVARHRARTSEWEDVVDDEPFSAADAWVEPYGEPSAGRVPRFAGTRPYRWASSAARVYRAAGARGLASKATALIRRRLSAVRPR